MIYYIAPIGINERYVKIGYTKGDCSKRLKELQTGSVQPLILIGYEQGDLNRERELHRIWGHLRLRSNNEFFYASDELIEYINSISKWYIEYDGDRYQRYNKMTQ